MIEDVVGPSGTRPPAQCSERPSLPCGRPGKARVQQAWTYRPVIRLVFQVCLLTAFRNPLEVRHHHDQYPSKKLGPPGLAEAEAEAASPSFPSLHLQGPGSACNMSLQGPLSSFQPSQGRHRLTWVYLVLIRTAVEQT